MKMTNEQMGAAVEILTPLEEKGKLGYAVARNLRKLKDGCAEYLNMRSELFQKYGEVKDNGTAVMKREHFADYLKDMGDIPSIEHEVDIYTIPLDDFLSGSLTSKQMESLLWMVKEDD